MASDDALSWAEVVERLHRPQAWRRWGVWLQCAAVLIPTAGFTLFPLPTPVLTVLMLTTLVVLFGVGTLLRSRAYPVLVTPAVASARVRDPEGVLARLRAERDEARRAREEAGQSPRSAERSSRGSILVLRSDLWGLGVCERSLAQAQEDLIERLEGRFEPGAVDAFTIGADLDDARESARRWVRVNARVDPEGSRWVHSVLRGWWVRIDPAGKVELTRAEPLDSTAFSPPHVEAWVLPSSTGDSAGLAIFLAYVLEMLQVAPDERFALAATGDMVGSRVDPVGSAEEKARAARAAEACLMMISVNQKRTVPLLLHAPPLLRIGTLGDGARGLLTARGALEHDARRDQPRAGR